MAVAIANGCRAKWNPLQLMLLRFLLSFTEQVMDTIRLTHRGTTVGFSAFLHPPKLGLKNAQLLSGRRQLAHGAAVVANEYI